MTEVRIEATTQPTPKKWTKVEIMFLLKYYPLYKSGNRNYSAGVIRGHLQSRTMTAISKKYWDICGSYHREKTNINQRLFDFAQDKIK